MATQTYIPAGSRIVVRNATTPATWHTTREEIILDTPASHARCPRTGRDVLTVTARGFEVFFLSSQVATREATAEGDVNPDILKNLKASLLIYDIPERAEINNPSGFLRSRAIRVNLSCWVIPDANIPYALLNRLREAGATWYTVPFAADAGPTLVRMAIENMKKELADTLARANRSREQAEAQLEEAGDTQKAREYYLRRAQGIEERLTQLTKDFEEAARQFGINPRVLELDTATTAVQAIKAGMEARVAAYTSATTILGRSGTRTGQALAAAAREDAVPAGVLADAIEDGGEDASGIRAAFAEDHTYSLVDGTEE